MDPWCTDNRTDSDKQSVDDFSNSFEDNFIPTVSDTLPDSKHYLETLGEILTTVFSLTTRI